MMNVKSPRRRDDFDDVEAAGHVPALVPRHIGQGDEGQLSLLAVFYGFGGPAALLRPARFYFDEDEGVAVLGDNVYFSQAIAVILAEDCVAQRMAEVLDGGFFAGLSQRGV